VDQRGGVGQEDHLRICGQEIAQLHGQPVPCLLRPVRQPAGGGDCLLCQSNAAHRKAAQLRPVGRGRGTGQQVSGQDFTAEWSGAQAGETHDGCSFVMGHKRAFFGCGPALGGVIADYSGPSIGTTGNSRTCKKSLL